MAEIKSEGIAAVVISKKSSCLGYNENFGCWTAAGILPNNPLKPKADVLFRRLIPRALTSFASLFSVMTTNLESLTFFRAFAQNLVIFCCLKVGCCRFPSSGQKRKIKLCYCSTQTLQSERLSKTTSAFGLVKRKTFLSLFMNGQILCHQVSAYFNISLCSVTVTFFAKCKILSQYWSLCD